MTPQLELNYVIVSAGLSS